MEDIRRIIRESFAIAENIQQADKIYFKTGILTPEEREIILSITGGDYFTRLVADWYYQLTRNWKSTGDAYTMKMLKEFYENLKNYNKVIFPVAGNLEDYNAQKNERAFHILELYSMLKERKKAVEEWNKLPSIGKRNLQAISKQTYNNEYYFSDIAKKLRDLNYYVERMPGPSKWDDEETAKRKTDKHNMMLNKIFASTNSLDQMVKNAEQFAMAFNLGVDEMGKDEIIDNLQYIEAQVVQNTKDILVIRADDQEAMSKLGCTSLWCFSRPGAEGDWNTYAPLGYAYVIYNFDKDFEDATFMMTYLPDTGAVYSSTNIPIEELGISNPERYLKHIGVDVDKLNADVVDSEEQGRGTYYNLDSEEDEEEYDEEGPSSEWPHKDPNQLKLNLNEIKNMIKKAFEER